MSYKIVNVSNYFPLCPPPEITASTVLISPHTEVSILPTSQQSYSLSTYPPWKRFPASEFDKQPADPLALRVLM